MYIYCGNKNSLGQATTKITTPHVFLDTFFPFKINEFQILFIPFLDKIYTFIVSIKYEIQNCKQC